MQLQCRNRKCGHVWNYTGLAPFKTNCPKCGRNVYFAKNENTDEKTEAKV